MSDVRQCTECGQIKPLTAFYSREGGKTVKHGKNKGLRKVRPACKECAKSRWKKHIRSTYARMTKEERRDRHLRETYGITIEDYYRILKEQDSACAICRGPNCKRYAWFSVDHCHKTGKVRGLLCSECNLGLGKFKDDPALISKALEYLNK